jgi:hypothetical protein
MTESKLRHARPSEAEKKASRAAKLLKPIGTGMMLPGLVAEKKRMLAIRTYGSQHAAPSRITNSSAKRNYEGEGIDQSSMRPGANDFLQVPSRFNDDLSYRDGRTLQFPSTTSKA